MQRVYVQSDNLFLKQTAVTVYYRKHCSLFRLYKGFLSPHFSDFLAILKELIMCASEDDHRFLFVVVLGPPPQIPGTPPPAYSEMPPPYAPPVSMNTEPSVICRVCQQLIYIRGREHQRVVKCGNCQEATVSNVYIFFS